MDTLWTLSTFNVPLPLRRGALGGARSIPPSFHLPGRPRGGAQWPPPGLPAAWVREQRALTTRAGNRRFWCLCTLRAHTKAPYKTDLHRKTLRALKRPGGPGQEPMAPAASGFASSIWPREDARHARSGHRRPSGPRASDDHWHKRSRIHSCREGGRASCRK